MARLHPPLLLAAAGDPLRIVTRRRRPWDRVLARSRSLTLDAQLADGHSPDDNWLRLVRAELLISRHGRVEIARHWETVLERCSRQGNEGRLRVPLQYQQIRAAEPGIRRLIAALRSRLAINVRGVAMASLLLTDGTGPLYNPARSADLRAFVSAAADHLDPMTLLETA
ncbi:MAG TPA: hypothetical protein VHZ96_24695 [Frankiaceae bacterium]|jgi:hypothetical protein|nr:hypothetical protein [Frankiaceae bacterium]